MWAPAHGYHFGLRPMDMGWLTPHQLDDVNRALEEMQREADRAKRG